MKKYIIIVCLIGCSMISKAARKDSTFFKHQSGVGISTYLRPAPYNVLLNGTFNYNIRYHFKILSDNKSLSANINTGIGFPGLYIYGITISQYFQIQVPVTINYNLGNSATQHSSQSTGAYAGAGICADFIANPYRIKTNALSIGPVVNAGFRFGSSTDDSNHARYDLKFSYLSTLNKNGKGLADIFGINFYYSF